VKHIYYCAQRRVYTLVLIEPLGREMIDSNLRVPYDPPTRRLNTKTSLHIVTDLRSVAGQVFIETRQCIKSIAHVYTLQELHVLRSTIEMMIPQDPPIPLHTPHECCAAAYQVALPVNKVAATNGPDPGIVEMSQYPFEPITARPRIIIRDGHQSRAHVAKAAVKGLNLARTVDRCDSKRDARRERFRDRPRLWVIISDHNDDLRRSRALHRKRVQTRSQRLRTLERWNEY
jgi:hypothetical protein